jgi:tetratricopeptide (TPR) repeat protein
LLHLKRYEEARECFNAAIREKPDADVAYFNKGLTYSDE